MKKNKKKSAFVDYSFHRKTQSSKFLKDLFSKDYDLKEVWCDNWRSQKRIIMDYLNKNNFHTIFFFQCLFPARYLRKLKCKQIVWFPMYDSEEFTHYSSYIAYLGLNLKIFSFSKKLYNKLKKAGLECYYYKYYPKPAEKKKELKEKKVFFWMRTSDITWDVVKNLLGRNKIEKTILKITPDPNYKVTSLFKEDIVQYNIQILKRWFSRKEFTDLLSTCNIFIAPRKSEGIGMSFLEALSQGMSVIAVNNSTMNEYIIDGVNGYLYDLKAPKELELKDFLRIGKKAKEDFLKGYLLWEKSKFNILSDLNNPNKKINAIKRLSLRIIHYPRGVIFAKLLRAIDLLILTIKSLGARIAKDVLKNCKKN